MIICNHYGLDYLSNTSDDLNTIKNPVEGAEDYDVDTGTTYVYHNGTWYEKLGGGSGNVAVTVDSITDATDVGKNILLAENATSVRTLIGAGTSSLSLGTTSSTALAGNGTAVAANKLATARTISLSGGVTGNTTFDGSGNVTIYYPESCNCLCYWMS